MNIPDIYYNLYIVAIKMVEYEGGYDSLAYQMLVEQVSELGKQLTPEEYSAFCKRVLDYRKLERFHESETDLQQ
jgi:hypothetical protein